MAAYDPRAYWDEKARRASDDPDGAAGMEDARKDRCISALQSHLIGEALSVVFRHRGPEGCRVLDFGCGSGRWTGHLVRRGMLYTGVDLSGEMLALAVPRHPGTPFVHADALHGLPFRTGTFDLLLSVGVLHHNAHENQSALLRELRRVLKAGGHGVLFEGLGAPESGGDLFNYRGPDDWARTCSEAALEVVWDRRGNYWPLLDVAERALQRFGMRPPRILETGLLRVDEKVGPLVADFLPGRLQTRAALIVEAVG